jgi:hypothetical protein
MSFRDGLGRKKMAADAAHECSFVNPVGESACR